MFDEHKGSDLGPRMFTWLVGGVVGAHVGGILLLAVVAFYMVVCGYL